MSGHDPLLFIRIRTFKREQWELFHPEEIVLVVWNVQLTSLLHEFCAVQPAKHLMREKTRLRRVSCTVPYSSEYSRYLIAFSARAQKKQIAILNAQRIAQLTLLGIGQMLLHGRSPFPLTTAYLDYSLSAEVASSFLNTFAVFLRQSSHSFDVDGLDASTSTGF